VFQREKHRNRPGRERQPDQQPANRFAPAAGGETGGQQQQRRDDELEKQQIHDEQCNRKIRASNNAAAGVALRPCVFLPILKAVPLVDKPFVVI
jgi:hypothetical protein